MSAKQSTLLVLSALLMGPLLVGCGSARMAKESAPMSVADSDGSTQSGDIGETRKVIRTASLSLSVDEPESCINTIKGLVKEGGGYVENSNATRDGRVYMTCRVPSKDLTSILDAVARLGSEDSRNVSASDVTDQYNDLATRLKNSKALGDRLKQLLVKARNVKDILEIEKELVRIQTDIERMQGRFDNLKGRVELSSVSIYMQKSQILGPLGYVGYGLWWVTKKLFVIR
ncbi:MAG: DUF4349 domain-containing protein [Planctomycetota bacterium]|nr:DUF4349 domain-containing protein [Planctomycetota bacterium]